MTPEDLALDGGIFVGEPPAPLSTSGLSVRRLADVEMRSIEWLDKPLFQRAAFQLVVGKKGVGKGTYLAGLMARISRGDVFGEPRNVLLVASEDSDEIDVKPRVRAAGGDEERIFSVCEPMRLPRDIGRLKDTALDLGEIGLIVIDPVGNHLGGANTDAEGAVRDAIAPLNDLAHELDCLSLGVRHLSKDTSRGALASVLGSTAWVDVPRAVLAVAADDEDDQLFHIAVVAGNRSARGSGRSFRIELVDVGLKEPVTCAVEQGPTEKSVDALLGRPATDRTRAVKKSGAEDVILRELTLEPRSLDYLKAAVAGETGASGETTWRAANALKAAGKVRCSNSGPGTPWLWQIVAALADFGPDIVSDPSDLSGRQSQ